MKINIGKYKAIFDREAAYLSKFNFVMILLLLLKDKGFYWYYLFIIPVFFVWVYIDLKFIMPNEFNYTQRKSPVTRKILQELETIKNKLNENSR